jgi:GMP synthase-like glutamine amidotransferase
VRALAIVHQPDAGPGSFAEAFARHGERLDAWEIAGGADPPGDPRAYDAVLSFGGAMHADQEAQHPWLRAEKALLAELLELGVPLLGVCLGAQLLAEAAGARALRAPEPEIGWYEVEVTPQGADDPLLGPLAPGFEAFEWHSYEFPLPPAAVPLATSDRCLQAYRLGELAWGIQFHAEVTAAQVADWIADYRSDEDAVRMGLDPERLGWQTDGAMAAWGRLGRRLCERFLSAVASRPAAG